jgi:hypothetical protein
VSTVAPGVSMQSGVLAYLVKPLSHLSVIEALRSRLSGTQRRSPLDRSQRTRPNGYRNGSIRCSCLIHLGGHFKTGN